MNGITVDLNADNLLSFLGGDDTYCADAAISVDYGLFTREIRKLHRFIVELFGLNRIYLIERFRRNSENTAAKRVLNMTLAVKNFFCFTENHARNC